MHSTCPLQYILERRQQRHAGSKCSQSLISNLSGSQTSKWIQCILALIAESPLQNMPRCSAGAGQAGAVRQLCAVHGAVLQGTASGDGPGTGTGTGPAPPAGCHPAQQGQHFVLLTRGKAERGGLQEGKNKTKSIPREAGAA